MCIRDRLWGALRSLLSIYEPEQPDQTDAQLEQKKLRRQRQIAWVDLTRTLYQQFTPSDFVAKHAWLFDKRPVLPVRYSKRDEHHHLLLIEQRRCITGLATSSDRWALLARLRGRVHDLPQLSRMLAESSWAEELEQHLPQLEACGPDLAVWFLAFRLRSRDFVEGEHWLRRFACLLYTSRQGRAPAREGRPSFPAQSCADPCRLRSGSRAI